MQVNCYNRILLQISKLKLKPSKGKIKEQTDKNASLECM